MTASIHNLATARRLHRAKTLETRQPFGWNHEALAGRLVEISGWRASAVLTLGMRLVRNAQAKGETTAWIQLPQSGFYPPDAADQGVDLDALALVRAPDARRAGRAADQLARSGGWGLVVLDLGREAKLATPLQSRLLGVAQRHGVAVVFLTRKRPHDPSLGSLISLRGEAQRTRIRVDRDALPLEARYRCEIVFHKDKRHAPGWRHEEVFRGPPGDV